MWAIWMLAFRALGKPPYELRVMMMMGVANSVDALIKTLLCIMARLSVVGSEPHQPQMCLLSTVNRKEFITFQG